MTHPFFDPDSVYAETVLHEQQRNGLFDSMQVFFEDLRCRHLREQWAFETPARHQDFGYSDAVNQWIYRERLAARHAAQAAAGEKRSTVYEPAVAMAASGLPDNGLLVAEVDENEVTILKHGNRGDFPGEEYTGFWRSHGLQERDQFSLDVSNVLPNGASRSESCVLAMVFSPKRIEQLQELNQEWNPNRPNDAPAAIAECFSARNLTDFSRSNGKPSRASRCFDILRHVPTLTGITDRQGRLEWRVPLLRKSPILDAGSWVAVCFNKEPDTL
jgi:hypothetical protein